MTKQTVSRLKQVKKVKHKNSKLSQDDKNKLLMYSISQLDVKCFNKMIHCGADVDKKQIYYSQQVKPIELILYEAAHSLYNNKENKFNKCIQLLHIIVENGANINIITKYFDDEDNAFMALFFYIQNMTEELDICVESFVQLFLTMLNLGAVPNYKQNYKGADVDGSMNNLDLFCWFMLYITEEKDASYYLPLLQQFFVLGFSLLHNTKTFDDIINNEAYNDTLQLFEEWPMQMILYCLEQKHTFVIL